LTVESELNNGTSFILTLPSCSEEVMKSNLSVARGDLAEAVLSSENITDVVMEIESQILESMSGKRILIVDDNDALRLEIKEYLIGYVQVFEAENGKQGLELAQEYQPDLIISDVVMPVMDGVLFCNTLKNQVETSHIPVVMLTAETGVNKEIKGLKAGAVSYVTKPFNKTVLFMVINNILKLQDDTRKRFYQELEIIPPDAIKSEIDNKFLDQIVEIIEKNLQSPDLKPEYLIKELGVSRTVFYSKMKSLTGQGVNEFIRNVRLKKSVKFLIEGQHTITQIAYECGFSSISHFTTSFTKLFGVTPTDYVKKNTSGKKK